MTSRLWAVALVAVLSGLGTATGAHAQSITGQVIDQSRGDPVPYAGVFLLDRDREVVRSVLTDSIGRYALAVPGGGEYLLFVQRIGYFETESPLVAVSDGGRYALDLEVRPEPIAVDPLLVAVRNEELERFWTLKLGMNPNALLGYRAIQGATLAAAKLDAEDNTDMFRRLYIPVSHGIQACIQTFGLEMPNRPGAMRDASGPRSAPGARQCGSLYVDDYQKPVELLESIDRASIAVVVVFAGSVHLYTRTFDWSMRPGSG